MTTLMSFKFTKMHGLGNDFVVIDAIRQAVTLTTAQIRALADRHWGIGFDQLLLVEVSQDPEADFRYRIFNADGEEIEQCGNGARCFARFVYDEGLTDKKEICVETAGGLIRPRLQDNGLVSVDMGIPVLTPHQIPFITDTAALQQPLTLDTLGITVSITAVSMGNPHAVQSVADTDHADVARQGPLIAQHPQFPSGANAGFMQIVNPHAIRLRVFERGSGETMACGTGACAAVAAGITQQHLQSPVNVHMPGGILQIEWPAPDASLWMTGPAQRVFDGQIGSI